MATGTTNNKGTTDMMNSIPTTTARASRPIQPGDMTTEIDGQTLRLGNPTAPCTCTDRKSDRMKCDRVGHGVPTNSPEDAEAWNRMIVNGEVSATGSITYPAVR